MLIKKCFFDTIRKRIYFLTFSTMKKGIATLFMVALMTTLVFPITIALAQCTDNDNDGWVSEITVKCPPAVIKKGGEDCVDKEDSINPIKDNAGNIIKAKDINPGAIDVPGNGIDENCDGEDAGFTQKTNQDAEGVLNNIRDFLIWIVGGISVIILIYGGILYATAAGEESKTKKARKAMLGAIIGLAIALLASVIINVVSSNIAASLVR